MSLTYGFYDSDEGDRRYDARQISKIFDGLISDGVYQTIGDCLMVTVDEENQNLLIGTGRAWFNHTWSYNDAPYILEAETYTPEPSNGSIYYAICLVINEKERSNYISVIKGSPAVSNPEKPVLTRANGIYEYPLAYILRTRDVDHSPITQASVENAVGTDDCPFVMALVEPAFSLQDLILQFRVEYEETVEKDTAQLNNTLQEALQNIAGLESSTEEDILNWYNNLVAQINENAAVNLQNQIGTLSNLKTEKKTNLVEAINQNIFIKYNKYLLDPWIGGYLEYFSSESEINKAFPNFEEFYGDSEAIVLHIKKKIPLSKSMAPDEEMFKSEEYLHPGDVILCATDDPVSYIRTRSRWIQDFNMDGFQIGEKPITLSYLGTDAARFYNEKFDGVINRIIPSNLIGNFNSNRDDYNWEFLLGTPVNPATKDLIVYPWYRSGMTTIQLTYFGMLEFKNKTYRILLDNSNQAAVYMNPEMVKTDWMEGEEPNPYSLVGRELLGSRIETIWENLDPSAAMSRVTIYLDSYDPEHGVFIPDGRSLTDYKYIIVFCSYDSNIETPISTTIIDVENIKKAHMVRSYLSIGLVSTGTYPAIRSRRMDLKDDGSCTFYSGYNQACNAAKATENNKYMMPLKLIGILH